LLATTAVLMVYGQESDIYNNDEDGYGGADNYNGDGYGDNAQQEYGDSSSYPEDYANDPYSSQQQQQQQQQYQQQDDPQQDNLYADYAARQDLKEQGGSG
jgi:hypothetical protein